MFTPGRSCKSCEIRYTNFKKEPVPCSLGKCPFGKPMLYQGNILAWELYEKVASQVIVAGMGDIISVNYLAIEFIFKLYRIEDPDIREDLFEKIVILDSVRRQQSNQEMRAKMQTAKTKK